MGDSFANTLVCYAIERLHYCFQCPSPPRIQEYEPDTTSKDGVAFRSRLGRTKAYGRDQAVVLIQLDRGRSSIVSLDKKRAENGFSLHGKIQYES